MHQLANDLMKNPDSNIRQLRERLDFVSLNAESVQAMSEISEVIVGSLDHALDTFYARVKSVPETARFFSSDAHIGQAKAMQKKHWARISSGRFDQDYVNAVTTIGRTHARLGLEPRWYIGGYALMVEQILRAVIGHELKGFLQEKKARRLSASLSAIMKSAFLDMDYAISTYLEALAVERQKAEQQRLALEADQEEALKALDNALNDLADGDLTSTIEAKLAPQFDRLKENFNKSVAGLERTFAEIIKASELVATNSQELSTATDDMSRRTEQQASSLEQTAAALEEIKTISEQSAIRSRDARNAVAESADAANRSGEVVGQAVQAMSAIETSSQKITQIIGVIDEIAFQTNLLALNAGVEAVRAGEAGRGFAVVAQEVRELAQRSANAAQEIKSLIDKSFQDVMLGVSLVNRTGEALSSIGQQVHGINEHISAIATSAQEQSTGVAEINTAVSNMDRVTQQNAQMVQETYLSTQNLTQASDTLARLVSRFKVGSSMTYQERTVEYQRRYA